MSTTLAPAPVSGLAVLAGGMELTLTPIPRHPE